jgi:hypothetical protein
MAYVALARIAYYWAVNTLIFALKFLVIRARRLGALMPKVPYFGTSGHRAGFFKVRNFHPETGSGKVPKLSPVF